MGHGLVPVLLVKSLPYLTQHIAGPRLGLFNVEDMQSLGSKYIYQAVHDLYTPCTSLL